MLPGAGREVRWFRPSPHGRHAAPLDVVDRESLLWCVGTVEGVQIHVTGHRRERSPAVIDLHYLTLAALLNWVMIVVAALWRVGACTPAGLRRAFGNRAFLPETAPAAERADRAAKNMTENMILFVVVLAASRLGGADAHALTPGAAMFFWARLAYWPVYIIGITYVRTALWATSLCGLLWIALAGW